MDATLDKDEREAFARNLANAGHRELASAVRRGTLQGTCEDRDYACCEASPNVVDAFHPCAGQVDR